MTDDRIHLLRENDTAVAHVIADLLDDAERERRIGDRRWQAFGQLTLIVEVHTIELQALRAQRALMALALIGIMVWLVLV